MNINEVFPSKYLKAADLQGRQVTVKIRSAEQEVMGDDRKLVVYFEGKEKGFVCNKTNANNIAALYGPDTDNWVGSEITLFEAMVDFQGKTVPSIRVRAPQRATPQRQPAPAKQPAPADDMNDEIPF